MHHIKWLSISAALVTGGWLLQNHYLKEDSAQTAPKEIESRTSILSGSWIYNAGDCDSTLLLDSVYEINFNDDADTKQAGTVNTTSQDFTIELASNKDQDLIEKSQYAIAHCDDIETPQETPFVAHYSPYPLNKQFVYYRDANLLVQIDGADTFIFRRLSRLREIKTLLNSSDNQTTG